MDHLQRSSATYFGRYFNEYSVLRRRIANDDGLKLLSFGCSTGEELETLRAWFPRARLYGCDLDWTVLGEARGRMGHDAVIMFSDPDQIACYSPYDAIFCNSVMVAPTVREAGQPRGLDPAKWLAAMALIDGWMAPGGWLQIINSNIPFRLHPAAEGYSAEGSALGLAPHFVDIFDLDGAPLCSGGNLISWQKEFLPWHFAEAGVDRLEPGDLDDWLFRKAGGAAISAADDEIIANATDIRIVASGQASFRSHPTRRPRDERPATTIEVDVTWSAYMSNLIRLERTARRIWFDGTPRNERKVQIELNREQANAFIDAMTGRRSVDLALAQMGGGK